MEMFWDYSGYTITVMVGDNGVSKLFIDYHRLSSIIMSYVIWHPCILTFSCNSFKLLNGQQKNGENW